MSLGIRKFIARSISELDLPEVYPLNRWLKLPGVKEEIIEELYAELGDTSFITFDFSELSIDFTFKFFHDISDENYTLILFPKVKSGPVFFLLKKVKSSPVFFDLKKTTVKSTVVTFPDVEYFKPEEFSPDKLTIPVEYRKISEVHFDVDIEYLNLLDWGIETIPVKCALDVPQIEDILATFIPTVEKIDLLDKKSLSFTDVILDEHSDMDISATGKMFCIQDFNFEENINYLIESPALNTSDLTTQKQTEVNVFYTEGVHSPAKNLIEDSLANITLFRFLEPVFELTDGLKRDILASLPMFQQEGAEFLFYSNLAFFYDEFELGKEYQAIFALKMLLRVRAIKSALIVTTNYKECVRDTRNMNISKGLWQGGVESLILNYSNVFYNSVNNITSINNFKNFINIITYDTLEECFASSKLSKEDLNSFDCIIFDDLSTEVFSLDLFNNLNSDLLCKYFWFLSDFDNPSLITKVKDLFPDKELKTLAREKNSVKQLPGNVYYDFVIDVDSDNSKIPVDLITEAKAKITELVFTGNIMRIQPAIFQLIHDSQRKTNFNLNSPDYGNKAKLLKYNIDRILARYDRLLIYTQFDDSGIKQLSEFLKVNKIDFIKFDISDSAKNIEDKLADAKSHEGKLVYLTNLKQKGLFFKFPNVSHLINFDNWWNPIARYAIEDNLNKGNEKTLTVYNYYFSNTFEYDLVDKLYYLGLKDKNIISSLTADNFYNIINESLWCNILGVETEEETKVETDKETSEEFKIKEVKYSIKSLKDLVKYSELFLGKLNLTAVDSQVDILNYSSTIKATFNKSGESLRVIAKCVFARNLGTNYIKEIIKEFHGESEESKIFLISSGTIESPTTVLPHNFSLIDGERLKSYLEIL